MSFTFTKISSLTGKSNTRTIEAVTHEQVLKYYDSKNVCIQDAFPQLTNEDREFILTGITPEEWDKAFGEMAKIPMKKIAGE